MLFNPTEKMQTASTDDACRQSSCSPPGDPTSPLLASSGPHLDQREIQADCDDGKGFILLTIDTSPGNIDTHN